MFFDNQIICKTRQKNEINENKIIKLFSDSEAKDPNKQNNQIQKIIFEIVLNLASSYFLNKAKISVDSMINEVQTSVNSLKIV